MTRLAAACGGFLLAVLWMDLMFDVQAFGLRGGPDDAAILASIAAYYRRVTTEASPMHLLIGATMLGTLAVALVRVVRARSTRAVVTLVLAAVPIALALLRVFPNAVRLAAAGDPLAAQADLARAILWDHLGCFAAMTAFTVLQLTDRD
jgi:hypothetical protein